MARVAVAFRGRASSFASLMRAKLKKLVCNLRLTYLFPLRRNVCWFRVIRPI